MFRFKQFSVDDSRCGMKVGTDGVLLGAWTPLPNDQMVNVQLPNDQMPNDQMVNDQMVNVLDVGTGSGLIALMLAQRCRNAHITALDIDEQCVSQARQNFSASPWHERLEALCMPLQRFCPSAGYHLIVSNPPYFRNSLHNPDPQRCATRHDDTLPLHVLLSCSARLLNDNGCLSLILPAEAENDIISGASAYRLYPTRITRVCTRQGKPPKRILIAFRKQYDAVPCPVPVCGELCLIDSDAPRSMAYQQLTKDFYL